MASKKRRLRRPVRLALMHRAIDRRGGGALGRDYSISELSNFAFSAKKETPETENVAEAWGTKWP